MPASSENGPVVSPATDDTPAHTARVCRCSVILVHGTWGRGIFPKMSDLRRRYFRGTKRWFEDGSPFCVEMDAALKSASLDWPIRAFLWSGANSVHDRDRAARDLSKQLREDLKDPDATAVIIAHSHGGNVVLRALQHLDSMAGRIRVVTLATPFLRVFARRSFELSFSVKLFMFLALFIILVGLFLILFVNLLAIAFVSKEVGLIIFMLLAGGAGYFTTKWLNEVFTKPHTALAIEEAAHYDTKGAAASRMLVIRAVDDEASLSLAVGSIGSRLSFATLVAVIPAISSLGVFFSWLNSLGLGAVSLDSLWLGVLMMGVCFGTLMLFFIPGAFKSFFFGREFFVNAMTCDVAVDSVPDTLGQVEAITLRPVEADSSKSRFLEPPISWPLTSISSWVFGSIYLHLQSSMDFDSKPSWDLRHGIYNHPNCVGEIVQWLRRIT
jgi:hypothetical protein